MYIACPNCNTNFSILPQQIGSVGRKVKCSKCAHIWHYDLNDGVSSESAITASSEAIASSYNSAPIASKIPISSGINLPAIALPIKVPQNLCAIPVLLSSLIVMLLLILLQDNISLKYPSDYTKLSIKDVEVNVNKEIGITSVNFQIFNSSNHKIALPLVRIRAFDEHKEIVKSEIIDKTKVILAPEGATKITSEFLSLPKATAQLEITLGNRLDLVLK